MTDVVSEDGTEVATLSDGIPVAERTHPVPNRAARRAAIRRAGHGSALSKAWTRDWQLGRARTPNATVQRPMPLR